MVGVRVKKMTPGTIWMGILQRRRDGGICAGKKAEQVIGEGKVPIRGVIRNR